MEKQIFLNEEYLFTDVLCYMTIRDGCSMDEVLSTENLKECANRSCRNTCIIL